MFKYPLNPYGGLMTFPVALAGGLIDSRAVPQASDMQTLNNFLIFRNRFAVRAPVTVTVQLLDDQGTPAPVTNVLSIRYHKAKMYVVGFSSTTNKTYLYRLNPDGTSEGTPNTTQSTFVAILWTGSILPIPIMVSFDGGLAGTPVSRLYISDYNSQYDTLFWNSDANSINNLQDDFADSGTLHNSRYTIMFKYQYSLWGTNFYQFGQGARLEMMRFSQPGLIPATEPDITGGINPREWWNVDHREVGNRGESFTAASFAGGAAILFKRTSMYSLFGYSADTWTVRPISLEVGAVGPYAATFTEDGLCYFWSDRGPHVTDGQNVYDIGQTVRKLVQSIGVNASIGAEYSPDDSIVYFSVPLSGVGVPNSYLAYQRQTVGPPQPVTQPGNPVGSFSTGQWLNSGGTAMTISMCSAVPNLTLPGPIAPPNTIAVTALSDTQTKLTWVNGDTAQDTQTFVYRSTSGGFTPGVGNQIATVNSGVASYTDSNLTQNTTYFYTVVHVRNSISNPTSGWSEPNATTWLSPPTNVTATSVLNNGITVAGNVTAGEDVNIYRRTTSSGYTLLITLANPGAAWSYANTGASINVVYYYQATASKTGATTSVPSSPEVSAIAGITPCGLTSVAATLTGGFVCGANYPVISWVATNVHSFDTANIYRKIGAGSFNAMASVPLSNGSWTDYIPVSNFTGNGTYTWRVDAVENGNVVASLTTNTLTANVSGCP